MASPTVPRRGSVSRQGETGSRFPEDIFTKYPARNRHRLQGFSLCVVFAWLAVFSSLSICPWVQSALSVSPDLDFSESVKTVRSFAQPESEHEENAASSKDSHVENSDSSNSGSATKRRHAGILGFSFPTRTPPGDRAGEATWEGKADWTDKMALPGDAESSVLASVVTKTSEKARVEMLSSTVTKNCPYEQPLRLLFADMHKKVEMQRGRDRSRRLDPTENIILRWDTECLGSLAGKLSASPDVLDPEERSPDEIHLFRSNRDSSFSARAFPQRPLDPSLTQPAVVFRKGVFYGDRVTNKKQIPEKSETSQAQVLAGRTLALSILAGALGVRVSTAGLRECSRDCSQAATETNIKESAEKGKGKGERRGKRTGEEVGRESNDEYKCTKSCERELERRFWSATVESLHATFYPLFHIDVLQITNLSGVLAQTRTDLERNSEYKKQWYHLSQVSDFSLGSDKAWAEMNYQSEENVPLVALLDTGCSKHEDYWDDSEGNARLWRNSQEDCSNNLDDDGNGYVDDCWGWNFAENNSDVFRDDSAHGTTMASLLVAKHTDSKRGVGIMKTGKIMCLKTGANNRVYASAVIAALQYAIINGAQISICAFTFSKKMDALESVFTSLEKHNHLVVASAGSGSCDLDADANCMLYPAAFRVPSLLVVGSSKLTGGPCCSSNWGKNTVHVFAPGNRLWTGTNVDHDAQTIKCTTCK
ncbi:subtilisin SUB10 [Toxoplasma gondii RUB]|uniref:subtilisin n=1 Tax=Toxoplasma gondii RUB TaxID=935652 RepID=A0A086LQ08_TOXGO|nr:subtilisin SUB10 [Toxoplasma gondii RUB]